MRPPQLWRTEFVSNVTSRQLEHDIPHAIYVRLPIGVAAVVQVPAFRYKGGECRIVTEDPPYLLAPNSVGLRCSGEGALDDAREVLLVH